MEDLLQSFQTIDEREEILDDFKEICKKTPEHDMCKQKGGHYHCPADEGDFKHMPFSEDDKNDMLFFTNEKRRAVNF